MVSELYTIFKSSENNEIIMNDSEYRVYIALHMRYNSIVNEGDLGSMSVQVYQAMIHAEQVEKNFALATLHILPLLNGQFNLVITFVKHVDFDPIDIEDNITNEELLKKLIIKKIRECDKNKNMICEVYIDKNIDKDIDIERIDYHINIPSPISICNNNVYDLLMEELEDTKEQIKIYYAMTSKPICY